jgi:hypothetical protein
MMLAGRSAGFLEGLTIGMFGSAIGAGALLYLLRQGDFVSFSIEHLPDVGPWLTWAYANLGMSIPVFAAILLIYLVSLRRLRLRLDRERPIDEIVQLDHLTDMWTTLFFGTGVIWTAIGMRSALIFALSDPDSTIQQGAFAVLQKMVDGGILLALSTTILGGIGGYLMRVYKSISLGTLLQQRYDRAARVDTSSMRESLERIELHLRDTPEVSADNIASDETP